MAQIAEFSSLYEMQQAIPDEKAAIAYFAAVRWKNGEHCPYCGHPKVYGFSNGKTWKCAQCRQRFSIRVGTIFEDSKIPLRKWLLAIWYITAHKKGISSVQLASDIDVQQKTAWFMMHRLRHAARTRSFNRKLRGTVEADEGFFGGSDRNKHRNKKGKTKKVVALGMVERGGELRVLPIESVGHMNRHIQSHVREGSRLMTDDWRGFTALDPMYRRTVVNHGAGQYGDGKDGHTNSIEGVWALIKRQIYGIHHWVSAKHLDRYLDEATWRYNRRGVRDSNRIAEFLSRVDGRLTYRDLIAT